MSVITDFMAELRKPETLLRHFDVSIAGGGGAAPPNGQASVRRFEVFDKGQTSQGFTTGLSGALGHRKARPRVSVSLQPGVPTGRAKDNEFDAYYIPMVQTSDVANLSSHYTLPTQGLPDLVFTSQLSGCTFGVGSDAMGAVLVSHIQPNQAVGQGLVGQQASDLRSADLAQTVDNSFPRLKGRFVQGDQYDDLAAVIGRLKNGRWHFYMQANQRLPGYGQYSISSVSVI